MIEKKTPLNFIFAFAIVISLLFIIFFAFYNILEQTNASTNAGTNTNVASNINVSSGATVNGDSKTVSTKFVNQNTIRQDNKLQTNKLQKLGRNPQQSNKTLNHKNTNMFFTVKTHALDTRDFIVVAIDPLWGGKNKGPILQNYGSFLQTQKVLLNFAKVLTKSLKLLGIDTVLFKAKDKWVSLEYKLDKINNLFKKYKYVVYLPIVVFYKYPNTDIKDTDIKAEGLPIGRAHDKVGTGGACIFLPAWEKSSNDFDTPLLDEIVKYYKLSDADCIMFFNKKRDNIEITQLEDKLLFFISQNAGQSLFGCKNLGMRLYMKFVAPFYNTITLVLSLANLSNKEDIVRLFDSEHLYNFAETFAIVLKKSLLLLKQNEGM